MRNEDLPDHSSRKSSRWSSRYSVIAFITLKQEQRIRERNRGRKKSNDLHSACENSRWKKEVFAKRTRFRLHQTKGLLMRRQRRRLVIDGGGCDCRSIEKARFNELLEEEFDVAQLGVLDTDRFQHTQVAILHRHKDWAQMLEIRAHQVQRCAKILDRLRFWRPKQIVKNQIAKPNSKFESKIMIKETWKRIFLDISSGSLCISNSSYNLKEVY